MARFRASHLAAPGTITGSGEYENIHTINVNTGAASAVLTVKETGTGSNIAVIDASAKGSYLYDCICEGGFTAVLSGGNADVTVTHG